MSLLFLVFDLSFLFVFFFFKQKTAYEMRISDWSSDVCSSDLRDEVGGRALFEREAEPGMAQHRELHGEADPVRVATPRGDQREVACGQHIVPREILSGRGHAEQRPPFGVGQEVASRHGEIRSQKGKDACGLADRKSTRLNPSH